METASAPMKRALQDELLNAKRPRLDNDDGDSGCEGKRDKLNIPNYCPYWNASYKTNEDQVVGPSIMNVKEDNLPTRVISVPRGVRSDGTEETLQDELFSAKHLRLDNDDYDSGCEDRPDKLSIRKSTRYWNASNKTNEDQVDGISKANMKDDILATRLITFSGGMRSDLTQKTLLVKVSSSGYSQSSGVSITACKDQVDACSKRNVKEENSPTPVNTVPHGTGPDSTEKNLHVNKVSSPRDRYYYPSEPGCSQSSGVSNTTNEDQVDASCKRNVTDDNSPTRVITMQFPGVLGSDSTEKNTCVNMTSTRNRYYSSSSETNYSIQLVETASAKDTEDTSLDSDMTEYEVARMAPEAKNPFFSSDDSDEMEKIAQLGAVAVAVGMKTNLSDVDLGQLADTSTEMSTSPTSNSDVDPELPRQDYLDFWTCAQCNTMNSNRHVPFCNECYLMRKTFFPPRPRKRRKIPKSTSDSGLATSISGSSQGSFGLVLSGDVDVVDGPKAVDNSSLCATCCEKPMNGVFVHGYSAHHYCCYHCAKTIWRRNGTCPLCRKKIDRVVKLLQSHDILNG